MYWIGPAVALVFALAFFWWWPTRAVSDDTGITVKYMDNFARGAFYAYNISDGPVFGISSFLHGVLAGAFAASRLVSPLDSLFISNFIGVVLLGASLYTVLRRFTTSNIIALAGWLVLMLAPPDMVAYYHGGLETPLHVGLLVLCFAAYLHRRPRLLWAAAALAIMAKLDSLPTVAVLLGCAWLRDLPGSARRPALLATLWEGARYFALPLGLWAIACVAIFGSVLPQSAYAKLFFVQHPSNSWFSFFTSMLNDPVGRLLAWGGIAATVATVAVCLAWRRPRAIFDYAIFGLAWAAHMALYYGYNPVEQHPWYYAIPELWLGLQIVAPTLALSGMLPRLRRVAALGLLAGLALLTWPHVFDRVGLGIHLLELLEGERIQVGRWIRDHSRPTDRLITGFGHIARESGLYTVDYSGLNSRIATDYERDYDQLVRDVKPEWIAGHGLMAPALASELGYRLRHSLFNITSINLPAWRVYERVPPAAWAADEPLSAEQIRADTVSPRLAGVSAAGREVDLVGLAPTACRVELSMGLRQYPQERQVALELRDAEGAVLGRASIVVPAYTSPYALGYSSVPWQVSIDPVWRVASVAIIGRDAAGQAVPVEIIDPVFLDQPCR